MAPDAYAVLPFILVGALLYTSVGHGGATAYLAILTLAGFHVKDLVTTVLVLNVLAAGIAFVAFRQAGHLRWRLLVPFIVTSIPMAYLGGRVPISGRAQSIILGVALLAAAARMALMTKPLRWSIAREGPAFTWGAPIAGALLGFLAGATGIGGGIFLSPILLLLGWADIRESASIASAFIVLNSLAGLAAKLPRTPIDTALLYPLGAIVLVGALVGSFLGAQKLRIRALHVLLGTVLVVAGLKSLVGL